MAAEYVSISLAEMDAVLQKAKGWERSCEGTREWVYRYRSNKHRRVVVVVYSSIHVDASRARAVGKDAIRVCGILTHRPDTLECRGLAGMGRINRVTGWEERLKRKVMDCLETCLERARWAA